MDQVGNDIVVENIKEYWPDWSTVCRRSDMGRLYFLDQSEQRIYVVDETNAEVQFTIQLNHEPNRERDEHQQTVYLVWWRPAEGSHLGELQVFSDVFHGFEQRRLGNVDALEGVRRAQLIDELQAYFWAGGLKLMDQPLFSYRERYRSLS